jgi:hypothetical protein
MPSIFLFLSIWHSVFLFIYLSIYLSVFLSIFLSIYLSFYLSIFLSIYRSFFLFIYLCIYLSFFLSIYLSIFLSIFLSMYLSFYLSFFLSIFLSIYLSFYLSFYLSAPSPHPPKGSMLSPGARPRQLPSWEEPGPLRGAWEPWPGTVFQKSPKVLGIGYWVRSFLQISLDWRQNFRGKTTSTCFNQELFPFDSRKRWSHDSWPPPRRCCGPGLSPPDPLSWHLGSGCTKKSGLIPKLQIQNGWKVAK